MMRWKTIFKIGIIIYIFLMLTIECKTNIMAMDSKKVLTELPIYGKINRTIKVYSGDYDKGELVCTEYVLTEALNKTDEQLLTRLLKIQLGAEEDYILGIPNDSEIQHIELNPEKDTVLINMTQAYQLTNYGSLGEYLVLESLMRTVMDYYNVQTALISVDGKPYCSGHFCFEESNKQSNFK